jgi:hypothetical protein
MRFNYLTVDSFDANWRWQEELLLRSNPSFPCQLKQAVP